MHNKNKKAIKKNPNTVQRTWHTVEPSHDDEYEHPEDAETDNTQHPAPKDNAQWIAAMVQDQLSKLTQATDQEKAKTLGNQISAWLDKLEEKARYAGTSSPKQPMLIAAITFGYALFDIPQWATYVNSDQLPTLQSFQQTIDAQKTNLEYQIAAREAQHRYNANEQLQAIYDNLHNITFILNTLPQALANLQYILTYWQTYTASILQNPLLADALRHEQERQTLHHRATQVTQHCETHQIHLADLRKAIADQDEAEALRLHQQFLNGLI